MVTKLLSESRDKLDQLVEVLLHEETINQEELTKILGQRIYAPVTV
jgi:ATP-dependent Zn protease